VPHLTWDTLYFDFMPSDLSRGESFVPHPNGHLQSVHFLAFHVKRSHPLIAQTFLEVRLDKTENVSLGNVVLCAAAVFSESYDCRGLIFIECGGPIGRFRPLFGFGTYFFHVGQLNPKRLTEQLRGQRSAILCLDEFVEEHELFVARM
jgi:hypothetical protein